MVRGCSSIRVRGFGAWVRGYDVGVRSFWVGNLKVLGAVVRGSWFRIDVLELGLEVVGIEAFGLGLGLGSGIGGRIRGFRVRGFIFQELSGSPIL